MVPDSLKHLEALPEGRTWLASLPERLAACEARFGLTTGPAYPGAFASLAVPATRADGSRTVLKIQFPHRECEHEATALRVWNGEGAVRLLEHDAEHHALLIEHCDPGTHLSSVDPDAALDVLAGLLPRLWRPTDEPIGTLADESADWHRSLPGKWERSGRAFERRLLDAALETLEHLSGTQGEQVLLHQDLHGENVLAARREPWLVIDPKPLLGEREFGLAPIVRSWEFGHSRERVLHRLDRLSTELGLDRERARGWAFAQTLSWAFDIEGTVIPRHLETVRWLVD